MKKQRYFKSYELFIWGMSSAVIVVSFMLSGAQGVLSLIASLLGAAGLIFQAKGSPVGPAVMVVFSILYGIISYTFRYYGELATYVGMTLPMSVAALISWLRHPAGKGTRQVKIARVTPLSLSCAIGLTAVVTVIFGYILVWLDTPNIVFSIISVSTSFFAAALTFLRSRLYALAYAANDIVLIVLWSLATYADRSYASVLACFIVFLVNDIYAFMSWTMIEKHQRAQHE